MSKKKKTKKNNSQKKKQNKNEELMAKIEELDNLEELETEVTDNQKLDESEIEEDLNDTKPDESNKDSKEDDNTEEKKVKKNKKKTKKSKSEQSKEQDSNNSKKENEEEQTALEKESLKEDAKKDNKKSAIPKEESKKEKAIVKVEKPSTPSLLEQAEQIKKNQIAFIIGVAVFLVVILIFSVIFALVNVTNTAIISGVLIKDIDVSNLSIVDAKNKVVEATNIELNNPIKIISKEYETTINSNQIEFSYNIEKAAESAYSYGREGNIFQNNYAILNSAIFGKNIELEYSYNDETLKQIVDDIESKIPGLVTEASYYREGNELVIIPGTDGIKVNKDKLKEEIIDTIISAKAIDLKENKTNLEVEIPIEKAKAKDINIDNIYEDTYTEPKDAYYEVEPFQIYAEVEGVDFAISKEEAKKIVKEKKSEYRIPLVITPAEKTIQDIGLEAFPYLISEFSTKYDASNVNRSKNLAIAAGKIDGLVLMPGDEFSFNKVVGKRTIEEGYRDAKIYQNGQVVDGLAGGICQISSTLYNAAVKANLEITERRNHSFTTSYIRAGQDATVVYGVSDLKFKNTRTYPIKISASVNSGIADFKINGIKEEVEYDISLSPVTTGTIPFGTQVIPDPSLAPGQQVSVQKGASGLRVTTYKDTKLDGKLISREVFTTDTYSPMQNIIRVGP